MWIPVLMMIGIDTHSRKKSFGCARKNYGWLRRAVVRYQSGKNAHQFDKTIYELKNEDGRKWSGFQIDMPSEIGISKSLANMLIKGRIKSAKGWSFTGKGKCYPKGEDHPNHRKDIYIFIHEDGTEFVGTQFDFNKEYGLCRSACSMLVNGKSKKRKGWMIG